MDTSFAELLLTCAAGPVAFTLVHVVLNKKHYAKVAFSLVVKLLQSSQKYAAALALHTKSHEFYSPSCVLDTLPAGRSTTVSSGTSIGCAANASCIGIQRVNEKGSNGGKQRAV